MCMTRHRLLPWQQVLLVATMRWMGMVAAFALLQAALAAPVGCAEMLAAVQRENRALRAMVLAGLSLSKSPQQLRARHLEVALIAAAPSPPLSPMATAPSPPLSPPLSQTVRPATGLALSHLPAPPGWLSVASTEQLRGTVNTNTSAALALWLQPGVYALGGAPLEIRAMDVQLLSSGDGSAVIDAERMSRVFTLSSGAKLIVNGLTVANGWCGEDESGGTMAITAGADVTFARSVVVNSTALSNGGAFFVLGGALTLSDGTVVTRF